MVRAERGGGLAFAKSRLRTVLTLQFCTVRPFLARRTGVAMYTPRQSPKTRGVRTSITISSLPSDNGLQYLADCQIHHEEERSWFLH